MVMGTRTKINEHVFSTCSLQPYYISFNPSPHCPSQCLCCPLHYPYHFFSFFCWSWTFTIYVYCLYYPPHIFLLSFLDPPSSIWLSSSLVCHLFIVKFFFFQIHYSHNTLHYLCNAPTIHLVVAIIHLPSYCDLKKNHPPWHPSRPLVPPWSFDSLYTKLPKKRKSL
jgi:hypothetical protein